MQRDTGDSVALLLHLVDVGHQRHLLEEHRQLVLARQVDVVAGRAVQLLHVVPAIGALFLAILTQQRLLKANPAEQKLHQLA